MPVPAPPLVPEPCDTVGGPGGGSIAPGSDSVAAASVCAGMFSCATGLGAFVSTGASNFGGLMTGTVILSLPGNFACRGGSFISFPPPPPPPPGPGSLSQMMLLFGCSGSTAVVVESGPYLNARSTNRTMAA